MAVLSIHLQEGFNDDTAVIRLDGVERARRAHLTTRPLLGYAEIVELQKPAQADSRLELVLPDRGLSASTAIPASGDSFVAANIENGQLQLAVRSQPFGYA